VNMYIKLAILLLFTGALSSTAFFFFPEVKAAGVSLAAAIAFASSITQLLAAGYFFSSLRTFKKGLKVAYYWLVAGILVFSLAQIVPSLSVFTDVISNLGTAMSGVAIISPYALGALSMYIGMCMFARLLGVRSFWTRFPFVFGISLVAAGVYLLLPQHEPFDSDLLINLTLGSIVWCGVFGVAAMLVALRIRHAIGPVYKQSMLWIALALGALAFTAFDEALKPYLLTTQYVLGQYSLFAFMLTGILFLTAGLAVKKTAREFVKLPANPSYVDVVVGLAQLVSKPTDVDAEMDKARAITAKEQELSASDKATLLGVYRYLEDYLVTKEPLHAYTKEGLRNNLPDDFLRDLNGANATAAAPAAAS
jgi:hypothetical protein